ncbi:MAG: putative rane protein of unknown function [Alphaproteobacteria bacterium]|nr:putative rane protein of unknown function [Alphaproteobacteria bacterium]
MTGESENHTAWSRDHYWTGLALIAAALMLAAPLWSVWAPAMPDYPAHLASFELIKQGTGNAIYHLDWRFVPNLASEILVPWLARLTGTVVATKLFLTAAIFLWVLGPGAIHRALYGRTGIAPLFGAFFAYNANFIWGFFNYDFAAGLSFALFAAWIATEKRDGPARLAGFALAVTILYFCHIFAAAILLLMIAGFEAAQNLRFEQRDPAALARRAGRVALLYVPAALAFVFLKPRSNGEATTQFNLADTMLDRFESLTQHAFDNPAYILPILLFAGLALAIAFGKARLHPALWGSLALLLAGAILAPEWALGGWAVHLRLPAVFASLLFAAAEIRMKPLLRSSLAVAALAMIAISALTLTQSWRGYDRQFREFTATLADMPRGVRLLTVLDGDALGEQADQPYWHMAEFAVPMRGAFTPLLFTTKGQHVVQLNPPYDSFAAASAQQGSPPDIDELNFLARGDMAADPDMAEIFPYLDHFQCHFDIAVVVHLGGRRSAVPPMLALRHAGSFFSLYDIRPDRSCAK